MDIVIPQININGTSREDLISSRIDLLDSLKDTLRWFALAEPHGRDYPDTNLFQKAREIHAERVKLITQMISDIEKEVEAIAN